MWPTGKPTGLPGSASRLRDRAAQGLGEAGAVAREAARMFREQEEHPAQLPPRINRVEDVTAGLGLDRVLEQRILNVLRDTRSNYDPKEGMQRIQYARVQYSGFLRSQKELDAPTRMELQRRAAEYWRKFGMTDYQQAPTIRRSRLPHTLRKSEEGDEKKEKKGKKKLKFDVSNGNGEQRVKLHKDVTAVIPDEADYQHHATEHATHYAGYLVHKDIDPDRAEAHRHAANLHSRLANAMTAAGQQFRGAPQEGPSELESDGPLGVIQGNGENGSGGPPGGKDLQGQDLPAKPDGKRNPSGRDSELQSQRRLTGRGERGDVEDDSKDRSQQVKKAHFLTKGESRYSPVMRRLVVPI